MQRSATTTTPAIQTTNGHEPYIVAQATEDARRDRAAGQALADLQDFRAAITAAGCLTPRVDRFVNEMTILVAVTKDPSGALDAMFATLAAETAGA